MIQKTCDSLGLPRPTVVATSQDQTVRQMFELLKEEIEELHTFDWQALIREHTFTTVAAEEQPDAFASNSRRIINGTFYNRTQRRPLIGPISSQEWQAIQSQPALNRIYIAWRERDDAFLVTPTPAAGETIAYEYITSRKAIAQDGTEKNDISADQDTILVAESLARLGLRWRYKQQKGLDYGEDMITYQRKLTQAQGFNVGAQVLTFGSGGRRSISPFNVPEGSWAL